MIQDRLSDVLGELSRTLVAAYQIPNALARLCAQLGVQPDHALEYLQRYLLASGGNLREAAEQVTPGDLRLRRTPADEITRG
jgi:hypothetical protein